MLVLLGFTAAAAAAPSPNLLLVTIDTLRADRVGAYGYRGAATPTLDRLAREGVLVEDAVVHVPQTRPSHASLFTGRQPFEHGLRDNAAGPLGAKWPTLAERLRAAGYDTGAAIGAYPVSRPSGLDRGFAYFDDPFGGHERATTRGARSERRASEVVDRALDWLQRPRRAPFFFWVHLFDPHAPYEPPPPFAARFPRQPYDGEVAYADAELGRLLAALDARGLAPGTLVVVTSDHGEGLGEHGEDEHMLLVYDATLRVPLVLRWPGRLPAGKRVGGQFRAVDLMPTLLELLGQAPVPTSGASRAGQLQTGGSIPDNASYAESLYGRLHYGWAPLRALRAEGWKYVDAPRPELFHLREDPGETRNRLDDRGGVGDAMRRRLAGHDSGETAATPVVDPDALERLAALGYVGGGFFRGQASGVDPKQKLAEFQAEQRGMREALRLYQAGELEAVVRLLRRQAHGPLTSFNASYYLGRSLLELGRHEEAGPPLERALALAPDVPLAYASLAEAQRGAGRLDDAETTLARGLAVAPRNAELLFARGQLLKGRGHDEPAMAVLEQVRRLEPDDPRPRAALADLYRNAGRLDVARAEAEAAVRLAPDWAGAQLALGLALAAAGHEAEAARAFREALRLEPDQPDALFYLAAIERRAGRPAAAVPLLERLLARAAGYPGAAEAFDAARRAAAPVAQGVVALRLLRVSERSAAETLLRRLQAGEDFAALAREASGDISAAAGGWLGVLSLADLVEPLRSAARALRPGDTSAVIETESGFVILKRDR